MTTEKHDHTLLLFDIDGTLLLYNDDFPHRLFERMSKTFFDKEISLEDYRFSGKTDSRIISEVASRAGMSDDDMSTKNVAIQTWIADELEAHLHPKAFDLLPNVKKLLEEVSSRNDTTVALLTGNLPRCAELKLEHFDLMRYFEFGAFGDISKERNDLGPHALQLFRNVKGFKPANIVVIGDAVADVLVAKHIGARSVVTLTGRTTREEVNMHGPDHIFDNLSDTEAVLNAFYQ